MDEIVNNIVVGSISLLVLVGIIVGVTAFQTTQVTGADFCNSTNTIGCSAAYNLTTNVQGLTNKFGGQLPTVC